MRRPKTVAAIMPPITSTLSTTPICNSTIVNPTANISSRIVADSSIIQRQIAIIGIENWGGGRFSKYGKLDQAYHGTEEASTKILLSHDPTSWDAIVRPTYKDVDLTLSGHTHGFQFGVEVGNFQWSPSQYVYKQWAGLYQEGEQYLYVNRGFGFLGYPGRIGMPPELTIIELKKA